MMASPPPSSAASGDVPGGDSDPPLPVEQHSVGKIDVTGSSSSARSKFTTTVNLGGHEFTDTSGSSPGITYVARNDSGMAVAAHVAQSSAPLLPVLMLPPGIISVACGASHALFITRRCVSGPFVPCQWPLVSNRARGWLRQWRTLELWAQRLRPTRNWRCARSRCQAGGGSYPCCGGRSHKQRSHCQCGEANRWCGVWRLTLGQWNCYDMIRSVRHRAAQLSNTLLRAGVLGFLGCMLVVRRQHVRPAWSQPLATQVLPRTRVLRQQRPSYGRRCVCQAALQLQRWAKCRFSWSCRP